MLRLLARRTSSFRSSDLVIQCSDSLKQKPSIEDNIPFGKLTTDHMFHADWNHGSGWTSPTIKPYSPIVVEPTASCLHYSHSVHEGIMAYKNKYGEVVMFRPLETLQRMQLSADQLILPKWDENEFLRIIENLIRMDHHWILPKLGYGVYIRPTEMCTHTSLGLGATQAAQLYVIMTAHQPHYKGGLKSISIHADTNIARTSHGGTGALNVAGNYAAYIALREDLKNKKGYYQKMQATDGSSGKEGFKGHKDILWLHDREIGMMGESNFFTLWKAPTGEIELVTAPLDDTILPGINRESLISLSSVWGEFKVVERKFTIDEFIEAHGQNRILECFGTNTEATMIPVNNVNFEGKDYAVPCEVDGKIGAVALRFYRHMKAIQRGEIYHEWQHIVDTYDKN